jgi:hypothetical protein
MVVFYIIITHGNYFPRLKPVVSSPSTGEDKGEGEVAAITM